MIVSLRNANLRLALATLALACGGGGEAGTGPVDEGGGTPAPSGSFSVAVLESTEHVAAANPDFPSDPTLVEVTVSRSGGFRGPVAVDIIGLPSGVTASPVVVDSGMTRDSLYLFAAAGREPTIVTAQVRGQVTGLTAKTADVTVITTRARYQFSELAAGREFTCGLTYKEDIYCWGLNTDGQLGTGAVSNATFYYPQRVPGTRRYRYVSAGRDHACAIDLDWTLYCWGANDSGQLGIGSSGATDVPTPTPVAGGRQWARVSAGHLYTCAISLESKTYCWGRGNGGSQLGLGSVATSAVTVPTEVAGGRLFSRIRAGTDHTCAVEASTDAAYCWGRNTYGALGIGASYASNTSEPHIYTPTLVVGGHRYRDLAIGDEHSCGVLDDDSVRCWGWTHNGALGDSRNLMTQWAEAPLRLSLSGIWWVASSGYATCASPLQPDQPVRCWGRNDGQVPSGIAYGAVASSPSATTLSTGNILSLGSYHGCTPALNSATCWGNPAGVGAGYSSDRVTLRQVLGSRLNP